MAITYTSSGNCNVVVNTGGNIRVKDDGLSVELSTTSMDFLEHLVAITDGYGAVSISILTGVVSTQLADQTNAAGTSSNLARADHIHNIPTAVAVSVGSANAQGSSTSFAKADHVHQGVHSLHSNTEANRYGDLSLQEGIGIAITDDGYGNFTVAASGAITDEKVKISATDTTTGYLNDELTVSNGTNTTSPLEKSITSPGADEKLNLQFDQTKLSITSTQVSNFTEATQDVIGAALVDSTTIDFTYNDAGNTITAVVLQTGLTFGTPVTLNPDVANTSGSLTTLARADHIHNIPTANVVSVGSANAQGSSTSFARADHVHQGIGTGLKIKAGTVTAGSFAGSPKKATITFGTAFPSAIYAINITGADNRNWTWESKTAGSFVINTNANTVLTLNVDWSAIVIGESN